MANTATPGALAPQNPYTTEIWPDGHFSPVIARLIRASTAARVLLDVIEHDDELIATHRDADDDEPLPIQPLGEFVRSGLHYALSVALHQISADVEILQRKEVQS